MKNIVICGILIREGRILLVQKGGSWFLPGGKSESGETHSETLQREFGEELPGMRVSTETAFHFCEIRDGITPNSGRPIKVIAYFIPDFCGFSAPAREIEGCLWVKHPEALSGISQPTIEIITLLRKAGCF